MESTIQRQAIRAAVALASASALGQSPEVIADLRDEAAQLIGLCMHPMATPDELRVWCDDATTLMSRLVTAGSIPEEQVLQVSAAVLRLKLAVSRVKVSVLEKKSHNALPSKRASAPEPKPEPIVLGDNQKKVADHIIGHPGTRTKDIVDAFAGTFSARSIKRYLSELVSLGVVRRKALADGGVEYSVRA
jgi:hypothetical protein